MKKDSLTDKQIEILLLLYKFRFLHTHHFQKLLNHKYANRIQIWLNQLTINKYILKDYDPKKVIKIPAVYSLTKNARQLLKTNKECDIQLLNKIYRESERSETFKNKCLLIADIYLYLKSQLKKTETLYFATQTNLAKYEYLPDRLIDAYVAITKTKDTKRYFIEIIDENLPKPRIRGKIRKYLEFESSGDWEVNTDTPFPSVIFICPNDGIKKWLQREVNKKLEEAQSEIKFLLNSKVDYGSVNKNVWRKIASV